MMQFSRYALMFLAVSSVLSLSAQDKPAVKSESAKTAAAPSQDQSSQDQSAAKPASDVPVDAVKVTGTSFESQYFKFTYELPAGWKTLDDAARTQANKQAIQEDIERSKVAVVAPKKASARTPAKDTPAAQPNPTVQHPAVTPERYSLLAASPNGLDSLASPVLPRINIWAHRRIPPLDKAIDHAQLLISGKHNEVLVRPQELNIAGHPFVRVELINAAGKYQARYITVIGDYLVGFDFLEESEREMAQYSNTIKSIQFD
jgi:hypothetical protein